MKKLIIGAIAIVCATAVHAAAVSWALERDDAKTFGGLTAYVLNGSDYAAVTALLAAGGESVATDFNAYVLESVELNARGAGSSNTVGVDDSIALIIFADNKIANGGTYSSTGAMDVSAFVFEPPASAPADFMITVDSFKTTGAPIGASEPIVSPEPTSGLLLLLGVAGLALKRKRT